MSNFGMSRCHAAIGKYSLSAKTVINKLAWHTV